MTATPLDLTPYFQVLDDLPHAVDWDEFFPNPGPVELDIGCARGVFLTRAALEHPDRNYLGLELDYKKAKRAARKLWKRQLSNARVIGCDCRDFLTRYVTPGSVDVAHVYFPDPWWKRRHKRRRLFNLEFADLLARVVRKDGIINSWTDVEDYFGVISALMDHHPEFEAEEPPEEHEPDHDMDYVTGFERKKRTAGETIWRGRWRRR